jgi:aminomethyltransferase
MPQTPLHAEHARLGASFTDFGGWDMPVRYSSDLAEHLAVRESAGLFDISHMAEIFVTGPGSAAFLDYALVGQASAIANGKAKYSVICNAQGNIIDDLIVYRLADDQYLVIANAGNRHAVVEALNERATSQGFQGVADRSDEFALLAIQGPTATSILQTLTDVDLSALPYYSIGTGNVSGVSSYLCRTGYTGEDGFEISVPQAAASPLAQALLAQDEVAPIGLGARNSLRLEAGLCLYGQDMDVHTTPVEAGLNWAIQKIRRSAGDRAGGFPGADHVLAQLDGRTPVHRRRVGLQALDRVPVREHTELQSMDGQRVGEVTSGLLGPSIDQPIAMAYVDTAHALIGQRLNAIVRGKAVPMQIAPMPFVPNRYHRGPK